jgi:cyclic pyranopterin phosphate synthase
MARLKLTHLDGSGKARMVDVASKPVTARKAVASAKVLLSARTLALLGRGGLPKGEALETARLAGIQAAKRTSDLIPLCHPLRPTHIDVATSPEPDGIRLTATVSGLDRTGYEMEALVGAAVAALALYDMVKAAERGAVIESVRLEEKSGGRSGLYRRASTKRPRAKKPASRARR